MIAITEPVVALIKPVVAIGVCGRNYQVRLWLSSLWSQFTTGLHLWHNYLVSGCDLQDCGHHCRVCGCVNRVCGCVNRACGRIEPVIAITEPVVALIKSGCGC